MTAHEALAQSNHHFTLHGYQTEWPQKCLSAHNKEHLFLSFPAFFPRFSPFFFAFIAYPSFFLLLLRSSCSSERLPLNAALQDMDNPVKC